MPLILSGNNLSKPITDATAISSDVASGKVFYNNDGREVGSGIVLKQYVWTPEGSFGSNWITYFSQVYYKDNPVNGVRAISSISNSQSIKKYIGANLTILPGSPLLAIKEGITYGLAYSNSGWAQYSALNVAIDHNTNSVAFIETKDNIPIIFYYI